MELKLGPFAETTELKSWDHLPDASEASSASETKPAEGVPKFRILMKYLGFKVYTTSYTRWKSVQGRVSGAALGSAAVRDVSRHVLQHMSPSTSVRCPLATVQEHVFLKTHFPLSHYTSLQIADWQRKCFISVI